MKKMFLLMAFLMSLCAEAQNLNISGVVMKAKKIFGISPVAGASVVVKGTTTGVTTDVSGNYNISAPPDAILVVSFRGMKTTEVAINGRSRLDIMMGNNENAPAAANNLSITVKGNVRDKNCDPVVGASVVVKGTTTGATTDINGYYSINAPADGNLQVSFRGMGTYKEDIRGRERIDIKMGSGTCTTQSQSTEREELLRQKAITLKQAKDPAAASNQPSNTLPPANTTIAPAAPAPTPTKFNDEGEWFISMLDAARPLDYLSDIEKDVILELNKVRSNPKKYAELYLRPWLNTKEYSSGDAAVALPECIAEMERTSAMPVLKPEHGLYLAARDHVKNQGTAGTFEHQGSDGSNVEVRTKRYGTYGSTSGYAENMSGGMKTVRDIVVQLLVDSGIPSRGHRKNILNRKLTQVGTAVGTHKTYGTMCVQNFAAGYVSSK